MSTAVYYTYLLRCADGSVYTGITTDLVRRAAEHFSLHTNSKYTSSHRAVKMEAAFCSSSRADAARLEYRIKRLSRAQKEAIIASRSLTPLGSTIDAERYVYTPAPGETGAPLHTESQNRKEQGNKKQ